MRLRLSIDLSYLLKSVVKVLVHEHWNESSVIILSIIMTELPMHHLPGGIDSSYCASLTLFETVTSLL